MGKIKSEKEKEIEEEEEEVDGEKKERDMPYWSCADKVESKEVEDPRWIDRAKEEAGARGVAPVERREESLCSRPFIPLAT